jgi:hypothetical protein
MSAKCPHAAPIEASLSPMRATRLRRKVAEFAWAEEMAEEVEDNE